jgi:hypothetical protein
MDSDESQSSAAARSARLTLVELMVLAAFLLVVLHAHGVF